MLSKAIRIRTLAAPLMQPDSDPCTWPVPPQDVALRNGEIHLLCAAPSAFSHSLSRFRSLLAPPELERAAKLHFPADRDSYTIRHGLRRLLLSRYLQQDPLRIEFVYGKAGKPEIKNDGLSLFFSESHSAGLALFAVTCMSPVGVDIEWVRPIPEFDKIAAHYFSAHEVRALRNLPLDDRMTAFYSCWTSKEAYLKATGEGIGAGLNKVEITLDQSLRAVALHVTGSSRAQSTWRLQAFSPAPGYVGAVAVNGNVPSVSQWRLPSTW
jgi:4'-phosphopantetheinyl transferase